MKKNIALGVIGWLIATLGGYKAVAQDGTMNNSDDKNKKETQEVIIRQKGDKDTKLTVEITDGKVLINGKPIGEFNEDGVTVNGRKMIIRNGDDYVLDLDGKEMELSRKFEELSKLKDFNFNFGNDMNMNWGEGKEYTYLGVNTEKVDEGVKITSVTKSSPAEKAGLEAGDVIYKINDTKIESTNALSETIRTKKDGDKVKVYYMRNGKKNDLKATLATQKGGANAFAFSMPNGGMKSFSMPRTPTAPGAPHVYSYGEGNNSFGGGDIMVFSRRQKLGLKIQDTEDGSGVKVLDVEATSSAATAGLMKDDLITEIGGMKVSNTDEAREQLNSNKDKNNYTVKAKRNGSEMTFTIKIPKNLKTANL